MRPEFFKGGRKNLACSEFQWAESSVSRSAKEHMNMMYSKHNTPFLLSLTLSGAEDAHFIVSNQVKNSIENFMTMIGDTK